MTNLDIALSIEIGNEAKAAEVPKEALLKDDDELWIKKVSLLAGPRLTCANCLYRCLLEDRGICPQCLVPHVASWYYITKRKVQS